jgi:hypothetical protein
MYIICDENLIIKDLSDEITYHLYYKREDLIGKFIGIIMNDLMSNLHKHIFLNKYNSSNIVDKKILLNKISAHSLKRQVIIYDKYKNPQYVFLSINLKDNLFVIDINYNHLASNNNINLYTVDIYKDNYFKLYDNDINLYSLDVNRTRSFKLTKNNIIIICIDFINSTDLLKRKGVKNTIDINVLFYSDIITLIKYKYYPYIYIHEILGDSYMLVLNIDWGYSILDFSASIAFNFINDLYDLTNDYIDIRVGISYGRIYYGYIDHNIRFFGEILNLASRLENKCEKKEILVCKNFYEKLKRENNFNDIKFKIENLHLKGFDEIICVRINLDTFKYNLFDK